MSWMQEVAQLEDWDTSDDVLAGGGATARGVASTGSRGGASLGSYQSPPLLKEVTSVFLAALVTHNTANKKHFG